MGKFCDFTKNLFGFSQGQTPKREVMDHKTVEDYILGLPNTKLDYPFGESVAVYKFIPADNARRGAKNPDITGANRGKMFALIQEGSKPVRLSLKCDPKLSKLLREKYETVMPGYHLNKKHWNTILLTGQLPWDDIKGLVEHSYNLVQNQNS